MHTWKKFFVIDVTHRNYKSFVILIYDMYDGYFNFNNSVRRTIFQDRNKTCRKFIRLMIFWKLKCAVGKRISTCVCEYKGQGLRSKVAYAQA